MTTVNVRKQGSVSLVLIGTSAPQTNPLPFLINDAPTYVMALRDMQGVLRTLDVSACIGTEASEVEIKGAGMRIAAEFRSSQTMYHATINTGGKTLGSTFTDSSELSEELVLSKPGDMDELPCSDSNSRVAGTRKFHNPDIPGL